VEGWAIADNRKEEEKKRWRREEVARGIADFEKGCGDGKSQRQLAEELKIPRSTLQHWLERKESIDAEPEVVAFFESPAGVAFLHRLVLAAHFVITLFGAGGIRLVCLFLELSGLSQFVAASYGAQQQVSVAMEEVVVEFGQEEGARLAEGMEAKKITVCEDETFHPEICLVAIEPASNYIVLEKYADSRKAAEWTKAMEQATAGLPIEIVQSTSDEGRGILSHAKKDLGAHHSPDVFHVEQELVKGSSFALSRRKRKAEEAVAKAMAAVKRHHEEKEAYHSRKPRRPGRPPGFDKRIKKAQEKEKEAKQSLERAEAHQERAKQAIRGISQVYHPYDLETGAPRSAEEVSAALEKQFSEIEKVAAEAALPERSLKKIHKAKRLVVEMVATIAFVFLGIRARVEALSLAAEVEQVVYANLIPAIYLHLVSEKASSAAQRHQLQAQSEELLSPLLARDGPFEGLDKEDVALIEKVAIESAQLFQRSSSCVEGRNGLLALFHHSLHRLSNRKLSALTTVHNYFVKRSDGTTAAERFFGSPPKDLFERLLERVDIPGRPAQKRSQPNRKVFLPQPVV